MLKTQIPLLECEEICTAIHRISSERYVCLNNMLLRANLTAIAVGVVSSFVGLVGRVCVSSKYFNENIKTEFPVFKAGVTNDTTHAMLDGEQRQL